MKSTFKTFAARNFETLLHLILWTTVIVERWIQHKDHENYMALVLYQTFSIAFTFIIPFYLNAFVLIPKFLNKSKWPLFLLSLIGTTLSIFIIRGLLTLQYFSISNYDYDPQAEFIRWSFRGLNSLHTFILSPAVLMLSLSTAYRIIKDWFISEKIKGSLESAKAKMELALLRSQLDPHFLFNTLNSIYALALEEKAQSTAHSVATMGTLMRYTLHDAQVDEIPLHREIAFIEKYIELQKLRLPENILPHINIKIERTDISDKKIAPMMLLPFIENVFKHGIGLTVPTMITIDLKVSGNTLELITVNTMQKANHTNSGIGLANVRQRLALLYPKRHQVDCDNENNLFTVKLQLSLL